MTIPVDFYRKIVDVIPILCVDVVITEGDKFLLVKRANEPLKGQWWVPGGRVLKGETIAAAAKRKVREELGIDAEIREPLGYFERHFGESALGLRNGTHTVSIVVSARPLSMDIKLDAQSSAWRFSKTLPDGFKIEPFVPGVTK